jgi:hypothetical protein
LLNGGFTINIITKKPSENLLLIPKPTLYKLRMLYQTTIKQVGLVKDLKIHIHGIPYIFNFIVIDNNVIDVSFYMLLAWGGTLLK